MALTGISPATDPSAGYLPYVPPATNVSQADAGTVSDAVDLAGMASIVSGFGSRNTSGGTYNAVGLLNAIEKAGQPSPATPTIPAVGQDWLDAAVVGSLSDSSTASGIYTPGGEFQNLSSSTTQNYRALLNANPDLASVFGSDSLDSGIINTFA